MFNKDFENEPKNNRIPKTCHMLVGELGKGRLIDASNKSMSHDVARRCWRIDRTERRLDGPFEWGKRSVIDMLLYLKLLEENRNFLFGSILQYLFSTGLEK